MVAFLWVALVLVALIGAFNLLLSFGMVRKLRGHELALSRLAGGPDDLSSAGTVAPVGSTVPSFRATAVDGTEITLDSLAGPTLFGFLAPGCPPCEDLLPRFTDTATAMRERAVAVVLDDKSAEVDLLVERLTPIAAVVVEERSGVLGTAFAVTAYPSHCVISADGVVRSTLLARPVVSTGS